MSQHDYSIANGGGAAVRGDINNALAALLSQNSGPTAPTVTAPYMPWFDTSAGVLRVRNAADDGWVLAASGYGALPVSGGTLSGAVFEQAASIAAANIDLAAGSVFYKTISGATTFTLSNTPASGKVAAFVLELTNGGAATITWWSGIKWAGGSVPLLTASGVDLLGFYTRDGGTTWRGVLIARDSK